MPPSQPFCFVVMPFGAKNDPQLPDQPTIDFDDIYERGIKPAIAEAGMVHIRADEIPASSILPPMYQALLLADFAIADLTIPNPNVFYELGVRHATRGSATLLISANHVTLPFDVATLHVLSYKLQSDGGFGHDEASLFRQSVASRLRQLRTVARTSSSAVDSPAFQLSNSWLSDHLSHPRRHGLGDGPDTGAYRSHWALCRIRDIDVALYELLNRYASVEEAIPFRGVAALRAHRKQELAAARHLGDGAAAELKRIHEDMRPLESNEAWAILDLAMSYRAVSAWDEMIALYEDMPEVLRRSVLVREQLAFALNRRAPEHPARQHDRDRSVGLLNQIIEEIGPNSYTYALLGTVRRDQWREALAAKRPEALGYLNSAIEAFIKGVYADCRDLYPGVNAIRLLEIEGSARNLERCEELLPIVTFAAERRVSGGDADYWDHATRLELALLRLDHAGAVELLSTALASAGARSWVIATTARSLRDVLEVRRARGVDVSTMAEVVNELTKASREDL
jgi:hypothetical protein